MNFFHTHFVSFLYYESASSGYAYYNETQRNIKTLFVTLTKFIETVGRATLPQLFNLLQRRAAVQLLRICGNELRGRYEENGRRSGHPKMVDILRTLPATAQHTRRRRMVGRNGRSISYGLTFLDCFAGFYFLYVTFTQNMDLCYLCMAK